MSFELKKKSYVGLKTSQNQGKYIHIGGGTGGLGVYSPLEML